MATFDPRHPELTSGFCPLCGERLSWNFAENRPYCQNPGCKSNAVDWNGSWAPGPVRMPTHEEIRADARRANWQPIDTLPVDRAVIVTRSYESKSHGRRWLLMRWEADASRRPFIHNLPATHWCEDTLGCPVE